LPVFEAGAGDPQAVRADYGSGVSSDDDIRKYLKAIHKSLKNRTPEHPNHWRCDLGYSYGRANRTADLVIAAGTVQRGQGSAARWPVRPGHGSVTLALR
jgi:hypothetical protein